MQGHLISILSEIAAGVCLVSAALFLVVCAVFSRRRRSGDRTVLSVGSFEMSSTSALSSICALSALAIAILALNSMDRPDSTARPIAAASSYEPQQ